jgi:hypothetical protein
MGSTLNDAICANVMYCLVHLDHRIIEDINPGYKDLLAILISFPQPFHQFVVNIIFGIQQDGIVKGLIIYTGNAEDPLIGDSMLGAQY